MDIKKKLSHAITTKRPIECLYHGKKRFIEPYHYGNLGGDEQLHCFQYKGDSDSGGLPQWRNFKLCEMYAIRLLKSRFTVRASYHPENSHYSTIEKSIYNDNFS
ncbi:hypothetical protein [Legionella cardiaca]|uniref:Uncharacterized protein n=1 Tax=Legionella cardiaca TaxID=1071983 RepID=A0ABY8AS45_9GAMM|nr:hypothetical protein [Legionella cardiaca]WED42111.1 hypothetical protein PXX05_09230 [Legionella cardiaca]